MKLVEVVVLLGAHCASPLQQTPAMTEVHKVHCAVIVEKDTSNGAVRVMPEQAAREPQVEAVVARHQTGIQPLASAAAAPPLPTAETPIAPPPQLPSMVSAPAPAAANPTGPSIVPAWAPPDPNAAQVLRRPLEETNLAPAAEEKTGDALPAGEPVDSAAPAEPGEEAPVAPAAEEETTPAPAAKSKPIEAEQKKAAPKKAAQRKLRKAKPKRVAEAKPKAGARGSSQCSGGAKPHWYTAADGRKKYRCRTPTVY